ncbi:MAG: PEP-CTERM sorting domain-containing protein [Opitutales bacterium]|nr:PEP-CTERM sorting domain-containing protein [Opitutales bacterium]
MKKLHTLLAIGLLPASSLFGNLMMNADFAAGIDSWFVFDGGGGPGEIGDPVGAGYVSISGNAATVNAATNTEVNFYQEFAGTLTPGMEYTFTVEIDNLSLVGAAPTALIWSKGFSSTYAWLDEFPNAPLSEGLNTITFTPTGDGSNIYQVGVLFNVAEGSSLDFMNPTLIPEPGTYALIFAAVGLGLVLLRRRRR